jgi:hypothetical protein
MQDDFLLTGSEDEESFHYILKSDGKRNFSKTIRLCHDLDYDCYEERFYFPEYYFLVGKQIPKIDDKDIDQTFVKNYQCDISNEDYRRVWNHKGYPIKYHPVTLVEPDDTLKKMSEQLYDKYVDYCNGTDQTIINR